MLELMFMTHLRIARRDNELRFPFHNLLIRLVPEFIT
jgi:hypothetical protein